MFQIFQIKRLKAASEENADLKAKATTTAERPSRKSSLLKNPFAMKFEEMSRQTEVEEEVKRSLIKKKNRSVKVIYVSVKNKGHFLHFPPGPMFPRPSRKIRAAERG